MDTQKLYRALKKAFPALIIKKNHPLAPHTTLNIGGPAKVFIHTHSSHELIRVLKQLSPPPAPITVLGFASNVLISDEGIKGIVIKNSSTTIKLLKKNLKNKNLPSSGISAQRDEADPKKYLNFASLDYDESSLPRCLISLDSGVPLQFATSWAFNHGLTGLQWFAGIPGTIGGAVWYNIHGGEHHFSELIQEIEVFNLQTAHTSKLSPQTLNFDYDHSYLQEHPELIVLSVTLSLPQGNVKKAQKTYQAWASQKARVQPRNSAGSTFKNILTKKDIKHLNFASRSTGYVIDQILKLKGKKVGSAQISPQHANFIINTGNATAQDYLALARQVQKLFKEKTNKNLPLEVKLLGKFKSYT